MIVYLITNEVNGKQYIGQTVRSLQVRWKKHLSAVVLGSEYYFHKAIRKYGEENFSLLVLHICETKEEMDFTEVFYISLLGTKAPKGYNSTEGGEGTVGHKHTEESIQKMRSSHSGHRTTEEHKEKLRKASEGVPKSKEHCRSISEGRKGIKFSSEHRKNISLGHIRNICHRGHSRIPANLNRDGSCKQCKRITELKRLGRSL
jgi:group I intron endonuclease